MAESHLNGLTGTSDWGTAAAQSGQARLDGDQPAGSGSDTRSSRNQPTKRPGVPPRKPRANDDDFPPFGSGSDSERQVKDG